MCVASFVSSFFFFSSPHPLNSLKLTGWTSWVGIPSSTTYSVLSRLTECWRFYLKTILLDFTGHPLTGSRRHIFLQALFLFITAAGNRWREAAAAAIAAAASFSIGGRRDSPADLCCRLFSRFACQPCAAAPTYPRRQWLTAPPPPPRHSSSVFCLFFGLFLFFSWGGGKGWLGGKTRLGPPWLQPEPHQRPLPGNRSTRDRHVAQTHTRHTPRINGFVLFVLFYSYSSPMFFFFFLLFGYCSTNAHLFSISPLFMYCAWIFLIFLHGRFMRLASVRVTYSDSCDEIWKFSV